MVRWFGPRLLSGCRGWTTAKRSQGRVGPSFSGQPHPKDRWGTESLKAYGCRDGSRLSPVPERQPRVGWGLRSSPSAAGERRPEPYPQDQTATYSPRPSYRRILFLPSHRGRRAIPSRGRPRVESRRPWHPSNPGRGGGERGQRPPRPVPPPLAPLTQRPSRPPF